MAKRAEEYLKLAMAYLPDETAAKYQLGKIYLNEMAQTDKAISLLLCVVQQNPNYEDTRLLLGKAYLQTNRVKEAIDLLQPLIINSSGFGDIREGTVSIIPVKLIWCTFIIS